jgi:LPS export ABC transporter protein LptC
MDKKMMVRGLILVFCCWLVACDPSLKREDVNYTQEDTQVEVGRDVEVLYSDSAIVRVRVTAPLLKNYIERGNPRQEFPEGVKVEFLNAYQKVENTLTAKTATRNPEKGTVIARDSVVMNTIKQERLETEELTWDEKTAKIHTDKFVKVTKPGEVIYGFGLEAEQDFSYWKILVPKGRIKADQIDKAAN